MSEINWRRSPGLRSGFTRIDSAPAPRPRPRKSEQGGYALLLVLLMAAIIAINLYMEAPRVAFQAQRNKEQMLMERGEQYKRAIGLFLRTTKNTRWPNTIEELENFNNKRFLRKRYIDPITGKDEWRLIHIVNGVLTDSITNKKKDSTEDHLSKNGAVMELAGIAGLDNTGQTGANAANRRRASEGGTQIGPDGQPLAGSSAGLPAFPGGAGNGTPGLPPIPGANGSTGASGVTGVTGVAGGPPGFGGNAGIAGLLGIPTAPTGATGATGANAPPVSYGLGNGIAAVGGGTPTPAPAAGAMPGNLSGGGMQPGVGGFAAPGNLGAGTPGANGVNISPQAQAAAASLIQGLLTQPRPGGMAGLPAQGVGIGGSGIAGVASKAEGESIMVYNDHSAYNEWEFIYDPMKFAVPQNPNTGSSVGTPASQLASGGSTGPNVLNQVGTPAGNLSTGPGMPGGLGMGNMAGAASISPASLTAGPGGAGATTTAAPGGAAAGGMSGTPGGSSAFGLPGAALSIRPGKPW